MVSEEFKKNVAAKDVFLVRSALLDYLILDRSFKTFNESLDYAAKFLPVFQEYNGKAFETDKSKWNETYLNEQKAFLMINFCRERVEHIKEVIRVVLPENVSSKQSKPDGQRPADKMANTKNPRTGRTVVSEKEIHTSKNQNKIDSGAVLIAGGGAVAVLGVATANPVFVATGAAITGAGVVIKFAKKK